MEAERKSMKQCIIQPTYIVENILNLGNSCLSLNPPNYFLQICKATVQREDKHFCQQIQRVLKMSLEILAVASRWQNRHSSCQCYWFIWLFETSSLHLHLFQSTNVNVVVKMKLLGGNKLIQLNKGDTVMFLLKSQASKQDFFFFFNGEQERMLALSLQKPWHLSYV